MTNYEAQQQMAERMMVSAAKRTERALRYAAANGATISRVDDATYVHWPEDASQDVIHTFRVLMGVSA